MGQLYMIPDKDRMEESLALAEEYGAAFEYNDFFKPDLLDDEAKLAEVIAFYKKQPHDCSKDTIHGAFLDVTVHSADSLIRRASEQRVMQSLDIARSMGVRDVIFHTGRLKDFRVEQYLENWIDKNEAFFRSVLAKYPEQQIFMENMFDEAPDILRRLAERMQDEPRFGICFDYAHASLTNIDGDLWLTELAPYIRHMHINDHDWKNDLHLALGTGKIDWITFDQEVRRHGVNASVLVEMKPLEWQRSSMQYMAENHIYPFGESKA